jgi:hypothetical protein
MTGAARGVGKLGRVAGSAGQRCRRSAVLHVPLPSWAGGAGRAAHLMFRTDMSGTAGRFDSQDGFGCIRWASEFRFL